MAKRLLRERAIELRKTGMSYSAIKDMVGVSKSTLSLWLSDYPLSRERINELRGDSERRIERCRATKLRNRQLREESLFTKASKEIKQLSDREFFVAGLMLYWAEGTKASRGSLYMTNTDPAMHIFFIEWLARLGVERSRLRGYLHLYSDMDISAETRFWSSTLGLAESAFRKPNIKKSTSEKKRNYKGRFGHGTCNIYISDIRLYEKIMSGISYIRSKYGASSVPELSAV